MPKLVRNIAVSFLLALFVLLPVFTNIAHAQTWYDQDIIDWYKKVYSTQTPPNEIFGERYTAAQVQWIMYSIPSVIFNIIPGNPELFLCVVEKDPAECASLAESVIGGVNEVMPVADNKPILETIFTENRSLSAIGYFRTTASNLHIIPEAQAQTNGFGFSGLDVIIGLWRISRNFAYSVFTLIIIAMAFMIMFRVKLSPQTVITVQSALPRIASALILITFSYAIAGLLVDLMYVFYGFVSVSIHPANPALMFGWLTKGFANLGVFAGLGIYLILFIFALAGAMFGSAGVIGLLGTVATAGLTTPFFLIIGLIITVILIILLVIKWIKIIILLLKTYANILIQTVIAPIQIMLGVIIPGMGFSSWLKNYIATLAVFPTVSLLFFISFVFEIMVFKAIYNNLIPTSLGDGVGDFINGTPLGIVGLGGVISATGWPPLLGNADYSLPIIFLFVSYVILSMIPKSAELVQGLIKGQVNMESGIGESFGYVKTGGVGLLNAQSAKQQREYAEYLEAVKSGAAPQRGTEMWNQIWAAVRGMSGGRVK